MIRKWAVRGVMVLSLLSAGAVAASGSPSLDWWVIGGGGSATAGGSSLSGTCGQWMVGGGTAGSTQLGSGFWPGALGGESVFLPLLLREA